MKLAVSNIAWETSEMEDHLKILADQGCEGMELSPSMVWPEPAETSKKKIHDLKNLISSYGLEIPSIHSLTYTRPELNFFSSDAVRKQLIDYIIVIGEIANEMECPVMVLGSAKSRNIGENNRKLCYELFAESLLNIAQKLQKLGVILLIEPLSFEESDCINTCKDAFEMIRKVNHPNFQLHIDLRSTFSTRENQNQIWSDYFRIIRHCHVANPNMLPPDETCSYHSEAASAMQRCGYNRYLSIEMRRGFGNTKQILSKSIKYIKKTYLV